MTKKPLKKKITKSSTLIHLADPDVEVPFTPKEQEASAQMMTPPKLNKKEQAAADKVVEALNKVDNKSAQTIISDLMNNVSVDVVENYYRIQEALYMSTKRYATVGIDYETRSNIKLNQKDVDTARTYLNRVKNSRIFEISPFTYSEIHHAADVYTTEEIYGEKWEFPLPEDLEQPEEKATDYVNRVGTAVKHVPYPEKLPFDNCLFIYSPPFGLTPNQAGLRLSTETVDKCSNIQVIGHIIGENEAAEFIMLKPRDDSLNWGMSFIPMRLDGSWVRGITLVPWILQGLVSLVNNYRTFVVEHMHSFSAKRNYKKMAKKYKGIPRPMPPPYYTIKLKQKLIRQAAKQTFQSLPSREYQHRFDVRGHERVRIKRGKLPLNPKIEADLRKRKYTIFISTPPDFNTYRLLAERNIFNKRPDEWMAVKISWVKAYIKGPENTPYVPSVRKVDRKAS